MTGFGVLRIEKYDLKCLKEFEWANRAELTWMFGWYEYHSFYRWISFYRLLYYTLKEHTYIDSWMKDYLLYFAIN